MTRPSRRDFIRTGRLLIATSIGGYTALFDPQGADRTSTKTQAETEISVQSIPEVLKKSLPDPERFVSNEYSDLDRTNGTLAVDTQTGFLRLEADGRDDTVTAIGGYAAADALDGQDNWDGIVEPETKLIGTSVAGDVDAVMFTPESFKGIAFRATKDIDLYIDGVLVVAGATLVRYSTERGLFGAVIPALEGEDEDESDDDSESSASGTLRVGVLQPLSSTGPVAYYGREGLRGFATGLVYKGLTGDADPEDVSDVTTGQTTISVNDVDYELHVRDTEGRSAKAGAEATELVEDQGVDLLVGCALENTAMEVIDRVVEPSGTPLIAGPVASPDVTDPEKVDTDLVFRTNVTTAMEARAGALYISKLNEADSIFLFGVDYGFGRTLVEEYQRVLEQNDVEVVGERFVPRHYENWQSALDRARSAGADGIVAGVGLLPLSRLLTTYLNGDYEFRLFGGFGTRDWFDSIAQVLQEELGELTEDKLRGTKIQPFTSRYHFNQYDNDINDRFTGVYTQAYGTPPLPDLPSSGTFTAASAIHQAVHESGSTDGSDIVETFPGMAITDTPKGKNRYEFPAESSQAISPLTIAHLVPAGQWKASWGAPLMPGEPLATFSREAVGLP